MSNLVSLQKKYGHLKIPGDNLIMGVSGDLVLISTEDYFHGQAIVNTRTHERYTVKYDGWKISYKRLFEVSKKMANVLSYSVKIPTRGNGYYLRRGTYRVADLIDGKLLPKRFPTVDKAISYAKYLEQNNITPELL